MRTQCRDAVRDGHNGLYKLVSAIDHVLFGNTEEPVQSSGVSTTAQLVCRESVYTANIVSDSAVLLSDIMKTMFNITLSWCDKEDLNEVSFEYACMFIY